MGEPIIYLHNFSTRAESDHLTVFVDLVNFCKDYYPEIHHYIKRGLSYSILEPLSVHTLLSDPYILATSKPQLGESVLRSYVLPGIKQLIENESVRELIQTKESGSEEALISCLQSCDVYYPRIMSAIFSARPRHHFFLNYFVNLRPRHPFSS